jgi:hypothetical protein
MKLWPYSVLGRLEGVLVSCLVAGRKPWKPGGDAEKPSIRLVLYRENRGRRQCQSGWRSGSSSRRVMKLLPYSGLGRLEGVLVSYSVAGREPCGPDGDAEMPSIRLVQNWGSTGEGGSASLVAGP